MHTDTQQEVVHTKGWKHLVQQYVDSRVLKKCITAIAFLVGGYGLTTTFAGWSWHSLYMLAGVIGFLNEVFISKGEKRLLEIISKRDEQISKLDGTIYQQLKTIDEDKDLKHLMKSGYSVLLAGFLVQIISQLGKNSTTCRITLFVHSEESDTFTIQARYSFNPDFKKPNTRNYTIEGVLERIWKHRERFFRCASTKVLAWHKSNGLPQHSYDSLNLKGMLYSGVRIDIDNNPRAILLLESENSDTWTEGDFNRIFDEDSLTFLMNLVRVGEQHFSMVSLTAEIAREHE